MQNDRFVELKKFEAQRSWPLANQNGVSRGSTDHCNGHSTVEFKK